MEIILGPEDVLIRSRGKEAKDMEITDFSRQVMSAIIYCDKCVYKDSIKGSPNIIKSRLGIN